MPFANGERKKSARTAALPPGGWKLISKNPLIFSQICPPKRGAKPQARRLIQYGGVCWTKSELSLSKIQRILPIDPPSVSAHLTASKTEKFSLHFLIVCPPKFFSIKETKIFLFCPSSNEERRKRFPPQTERAGKNSFPPDPFFFLPACFRASPDFFADGLQIKRVAGGFRIKIWTPSYIQCSYNDLFS